MPLLDRLLPPRCLLCSARGAEGLALCAECHAELPRNGPACVRCAARLPGTAPGLPELTVCGACLWRPPPFAAIHVPFAYAPPIDWLVRRLKFHGDLAAGRLLGQLLAGALRPVAAGIDAVVPVPLHSARLDRRGFNQADELARPVARALGVKRRPRGLVRARDTVAQMELPAHRRRANVRQAFGAAPPVAGHVLLLDDVVTTASTAREAARTLLANGSEAVTVAAVARA